LVTTPGPSALAIREAIQSGSTTAEAVCEAALDRISHGDPSLHAFHTVMAERALDRARTLDRRRAPAGPLHGVPIALKDNIVVRGEVTTAGSKILETYRSPFDATVVARLEAAGAIIIGKTNCDEFSMGSSTENSAFGPTRNPWALDRAPGGSSGGSAAAVAAGFTPLALGSDTGGSIRQPSAFCGVFGLKPTYGRVSRYGLIAYASSLDQIGPIATSVADLALCLEVISGPDPADSTAADVPVPAYSELIDGNITGLRVGVPRALVEDGVDHDVMAAFETSLAALTAGGATIVDVELPHSRYAIPTYYLIATAEASSNLARYDGVRYGFRDPRAKTLGEMYDLSRDCGFGAEVKRRIMLGTYVLSAGYYDAYYLKAQQVRTLIRRDFDNAFAVADVIATPTTPTPAFKIGEHMADPIQMYLADVFTVSAPLAGLPAISVPAGRSTTGLPIGFQLTAAPWQEATLLSAARIASRPIA
jgi:aspartyl-tRNA(Asn)/glutamyl-tRNA(Gln) amidotransferase subunit A